MIDDQRLLERIKKIFPMINLLDIQINAGE